MPSGLDVIGCARPSIDIVCKQISPDQTGRLRAAGRHNAQVGGGDIPVRAIVAKLLSVAARTIGNSAGCCITPPPSTIRSGACIRIREAQASIQP